MCVEIISVAQQKRLHLVRSIVPFLRKSQEPYAAIIFVQIPNLLHRANLIVRSKRQNQLLVHLPMSVETAEMESVKVMSLRLRVYRIVKFLRNASGSGVAFKFEDTKFTVAARAIILSSTNGYIEVLPNTPLTVSVPAEKIGKGVLHATLVIGANSYILRRETKQVALQSGALTMAVVDESTEDVSVLSYTADVIAPGNTSSIL